MAKHQKRHLSFAGFVACLVLLIAAIFIYDAISRLLVPSIEENIVGVDGFSLNGTSTDTPTENNGTGTETEPAENKNVLQLSADQQKNGTLILVDQSHPYAGTQTFSDFSANTNENIKPRDTALAIQPEILEPMGSLFSDYAAAQGWSNLQIDSTTDASMSLYSNALPDRASGYGFDIGLITSTGEVVPYIQKCNEWMISNSWEYGFIVRYPSDKTEITGVTYAPHHFRYVGKVHAAIMHQNSFCLEEYLDYLQSYTMESGGLNYADENNSYSIYYIQADENGSASVELPEDTTYQVSGDNRGGFILTVVNTAQASVPTGTDTAEDATAATTSTLAIQ